MTDQARSRFKIIILVLIAVVGLVGYGIGRGNRPDLVSPPQTKIPVESKAESPVKNQEVLVSLGKNKIVMTPTSVGINMGFESKNPNEVYIDAKSHPKLFESKDEFARLHVKEISGGDKIDTKLIYIAQQVPNHGSVSDGGYVVVDPVIGKVVDEGYRSYYDDQEGIYSGWGDRTKMFNNYCMQCTLPILEFKEYSRPQQKYVLANNKHIDEFIALQKTYVLNGNKEMCRVGGKEMTINEALKVAKDDDKCSDNNGVITDTSSSDAFITIGEYKKLLVNLQQIIQGKNIQMASWK